MSKTKKTEKIYLLVLSSACGRWTRIDLSLLSECHIHVAWITQEWPRSDPSYHLLWLGYASHSARLPTRLLTHSKCQKQDRCPWYPNSSPDPPSTSRQHFSGSPCRPDQTPWTPPSSSSSTTARLAASLSLWGDICFVMTAGIYQCGLQVVHM